MNFPFSERLLPFLSTVILMSASAEADDFVFDELSLLKLSFDTPPAMLARSDGYFYGSTGWTANNGGGAIYRMAPGQEPEILKSFPAASNDVTINSVGSGPGNLLVGPDGAFYGGTGTGGLNGRGVIFRYSMDGVYTVLHHMGPQEGIPACMTMAPNGDIYGCSGYGGSNGAGILFRLGVDGVFRILKTFAEPSGAELGQVGAVIAPFDPFWVGVGSDGNVYGITSLGGPVEPRYMTTHGVFFRYDAPDTITVLSDLSRFGSYPRAVTPVADGLYVLTERQLLHCGFDGTISLEADLTDPIYGQTYTDLRGPLVISEDGIFFESFYGGDNGAGYIVRCVPGGTTSIVFSYPRDYEERRRSLVLGADGNIFGVAAFPKNYTPPAASSSSKQNAISVSSLSRARTPAASGPRAFRFRKSSSSTNFSPLAKSDVAWLPAKADKTGGREVTVDILANDRDLERQQLTVTGVTSLGSAQAEWILVKGKPRLRVFSSETALASQYVSYQLSDGQGGTSTGMVAVLSPLNASFGGTTPSTIPGKPSGELTVKISGKNSLTATFTLAGKRYSGRALMDADDSADVPLKASGQPPLILHLSVLRTAPLRMNVSIAGSDLHYSATLPTTGK